MAYRVTRDKEVTFAAGSNKPIGGFIQSSSDADQTAVGPVYSPDGTAHWIVVDNLGALSTVTTKP